jgi:hypothetical protein
MGYMKLPKLKNKTFKEVIPTTWMIWACEENDVHYLVKERGNVKWVRTHNMNNCNNCIIFDTEKEVKNFAKNCIIKENIPKNVTILEYSKVWPVFEDGEIWYDTVPSVRPNGRNCNEYKAKVIHVTTR